MRLNCLFGSAASHGAWAEDKTRTSTTIIFILKKKITILTRFSTHTPQGHNVVGVNKCQCSLSTVNCRIASQRTYYVKQHVLFLLHEVSCGLFPTQSIGLKSAKPTLRQCWPAPPELSLLLPGVRRATTATHSGQSPHRPCLGARAPL